MVANPEHSTTLVAIADTLPKFTLKAPAEHPRLLLEGEPLDSRLQWYTPPRRQYSRRELLADRLVNFSGVVLAFLGAALLGYASWAAGDELSMQIGFWAHGAGLITMLTCSALYHHLSWKWSSSQQLLSLDHVGISAMIMGCYTPLMLKTECYHVLAFVYILGVAGWLMEAFKLLSGRHDLSGGGDGTWTTFDVAHVVRYLVMGWACVFVSSALLAAIPPQALMVCAAGGVMYTGGILIFVQGHLEFHMAIWHALVLAASFCFYMANLFFLVGL